MKNQALGRLPSRPGATSALAAALLLAAGCATRGPAPTSTDPTGTAAASSAATIASAVHAGCVRDTGTRLAQDHCSGPGRSYTQDELRRTGATNPADALRRLDPAVTEP